MPVKNSARRGSQSAVPVTKSACRGSQSAAPATKSARRDSQSAVPGTKSARRGSLSAPPRGSLSAVYLPRYLHAETHKVLRLLRNLHIEVHKVLYLPRNLQTSQTIHCACHEIRARRRSPPCPKCTKSKSRLGTTETRGFSCACHEKSPPSAKTRTAPQRECSR